MDAEGIAPAKIYYEKYGVKFHALVDPNYALGFGVIPHTFLIDEHGVVVDDKAKATWERQLRPARDLKPVTDALRAQWTEPGKRLDPGAIAALSKKHGTDPRDLANVDELASRYLELGLQAEARVDLEKSVARYDAKQTAAAGGESARLLGQAYFQLARACAGARELQVRHATMAYFLNPTIGFGKQISRLIAPEKFDGRADGSFDNDFREGTLKRLQGEREVWLKTP